MRDLPGICFPDESPRVSVEEVETRLGAALAAEESAPFERLSEELSKADHYLAPPLVGWPRGSNPYSRFFADFLLSSFGTYNYDALVEFALFRAGRWSPHDGYGVRVATEVGYTAAQYEVRDSSCLVLHLHGTYSVYTYEHTFGPSDKSGVQWMEVYESPRFAFDPHSLGFYPFERFIAGLAYAPNVMSRVVAPIPDKATGLKADFIRETSRRAREIVSKAGLVVAIGYAFSAHDEASYSELLESLDNTSGARVVVVSPDAEQVVERLSQQYSNTDWAAASMGFGDWVESNYPRVARSV
ncbi:MAG: hypothetical protein ABIT38_02660 [Gemmatimonadaceae bacterium]